MIRRKRNIKHKVVRTTSGDEGYISRHIPYRNIKNTDSAKIHMGHKPYLNDFRVVHKDLEKKKD